MFMNKGIETTKNDGISGLLETHSIRNKMKEHRALCLKRQKINDDIGNIKHAFRYIPEVNRDIYRPRNRPEAETGKKIFSMSLK
jgi:hypothetical protein